MTTMLLCDLETGEVDAVITAKTSSAEEVEKAISDAKAEKEGEWQFEDIENSLPTDCEIITVWGGIKKIYY